MIYLGLDEQGFNATVADEHGCDEVQLRSERAYYEFLHYFEDDQFIFCPSLNTMEHRKQWVKQVLSQLNSCEGLEKQWTTGTSDAKASGQLTSAARLQFGIPAGLSRPHKSTTNI